MSSRATLLSYARALHSLSLFHPSDIRLFAMNGSLRSFNYGKVVGTFQDGVSEGPCMRFEDVHQSSS